MNILVVKLSAIGDVIHALPVSYAIKETFPDARLTWVVEPPAKELLVDNPYIDDIIVFEKKKFKASLGGFLANFGPLRRRLKAGNFDIALDLQGLGKSAAIAYFSGAPKRFGTCDMREFSDKISKPVRGANRNGHIVERYLDVVRAIGCRVDEVKFPVVVSPRDKELVPKILTKAGVPEGASYAVLAVGANWPNKRWPTDYYAKLSDWLYGKKIIPVFVGGGVVDESLVAEIDAKAEIPPVNLVGRTSLKQLAEVISGSRIMVGGDTGPVHLAAGLKVPTVMLMGPTDAVRNGPYGQTENAIEVDRSCRYCWKRACPKGLDCLAAIRVEEVQKKIEGIIKKGDG
ncbi:MAG: glycosyltransferase family 9 protein [Schwartzia succinivorans]|jgi:heptosyltransferase-1|uniref:glycosyltransferase family 9 protein n=1 Tax=Schwartzia succinivorans TaxID=55507 RepID=UPI002352EEC5|nr:glycosyltransferase family 9 protein [Schwartzia succinivorans]MBE6098096.1 glycosyltransferase family 9 protein [Schwartzia succinivorans]